MNSEVLKSRVHRYRLARTGSLAQSVLILTVGMLIAERFIDIRAAREMEQHREAIARSGGGVIVMSQPLDCIQLSDVSERIAERLTEDSIHVRGLIIRGGVPPHVFEEAIRMANSRFPHSIVGRTAASRTLRAAGFDTTPVAIVVDSVGRIAAMKQIAGSPEVIEHLVALVGANR